MNLSNNTADCFVPDDATLEEALRRTTHLGVGAHPDDLELMALDGILSCFHTEDQWFTGVTVTHGGGSVREGAYSSCTDEEIRDIRRREQRKAASIGEYSSVLQLDYDSETVRDGSKRSPDQDLKTILRRTKPSMLYTHTPADRHPTHVGVSLTVLRVLQSLSPEDRPENVFGCEIWRSLDWLPDEHRYVFDVNEPQNIAQALIEVFDSQISGGKRYDRAGRGRRLANATFHESHESDAAPGLIIGMDLTPVMTDEDTDVEALMDMYLSSFRRDVMEKIERCT